MKKMNKKILYILMGMLLFLAIGLTLLIIGGLLSETTQEIPERKPPTIPDETIEETTTETEETTTEDETTVKLAENGCTDTDGGKTYAKKGTAVYSKKGKTITENEDVCIDETVLIEYFCEPGEDGKPTMEYHECECDDGACAKTAA